MRFKHNLIGIFVFLYFFLGFVASAPSHTYLRTLPGLSLFGEVYRLLNFQQSWPMFAPPPQISYTLKYATITSDGQTEWSPLAEPFASTFIGMQGQWVMQRGASRIVTHFRVNNEDRHLGNNRPRHFYFQALSDYYCFGKGKIPSLKKIRFYIESKGIKPFYPINEDGDPVPPASDFNGVVPVYERDCTDV